MCSFHRRLTLYDYFTVLQQEEQGEDSLDYQRLTLVFASRIFSRQTVLQDFARNCGEALLHRPCKPLVAD